MIQTLINSTTDNGNGSIFHINNFSEFEYGIVQTSGTATFTLQGRISSNMPWHDVVVITNAGSERVTLFPQMRIAITNGGGGSKRCELVG